MNDISEIYKAYKEGIKDLSGNNWGFDVGSLEIRKTPQGFAVDNWYIIPYKDGWLWTNPIANHYYKDKSFDFRHNLDGPAELYKAPGRYPDNKYWINGKQLSKEEFLAFKKVEPEDRESMVNLLDI